MAESVLEYLKREALVFEKEMEKAIPRNRQPWEVYGILWEHLDLGGKRLRPVMCKLSCEVVGGDGQKTIPAGAAIEMFHNFTLLHDDIEDSSDMRRGQPCTYKKYGIPLAINAGDGLFMMVSKEILRTELPPTNVIGVQQVLNDAFTRVLEGQAIEINWYRTAKHSVSEEEYFKMASGKTGALIAASCEVGAMIGGATIAQRKAFSEFGMSAGLAFQIQDDVLNLIGSEDKYGKEIGGDISEGKRSLITIHALANAGPKEKRELEEILNARTKDQTKVLAAIEICRKTGSIDYAAEKAKSLVEEAKAKLGIFNETDAKKVLLKLADFFVYREV